MRLKIQGRILIRLVPIMLAVAAVCYTKQDLMNARCDVACAREGYGSGVFDPTTEKCICQDEFAAERITRKKMKLPVRRSGPQQPQEHSVYLGPRWNE